MGIFRVLSFKAITVLSLVGCSLELNMQKTGSSETDSDALAKVEIQSVYSGFAESNNKGAPVFEFSGPANISDLKLYTDSNCHTEIASDNFTEGTKYVLRDTETENRNRTGEHSYYVQYSFNSKSYCQFLSKYIHDPVYIVSVLADDTRRGIYLGVDNKGNVKFLNTNAGVVSLSANVAFEIERTVKNPKKFGYALSSLYILTQDNELYIYNNSQLPTVPNYTDVKDLYFTTPNATSAAFVKNDGTVASFGSVGSAPGALNDVKELRITRHGFVALKNTGEVSAWGGTNLTSGVNPSNITGALSMQPSNFGLYTLGVITLKSNGNVQYFGHSNRPGTPSAPRLTAVNGKSDIQFYPGLNSLALTYTDAGITKGFAWTGGGRGGDSATLDSQLVDIKKLVPNNDSYVALLNNSSIVYWGLNGTSNTLPSVPESTGVADVIPNDYTISETVNLMEGHAFAMLRQDGTVTSMGHNSFGGDMSAVAASVNQGSIGVKKVVSTGRGFAALRNDGKVFVWGGCGDQTKVSELSNIDDIVSSRARLTTTCGFVARSTNGDLYLVSNSEVKAYGVSLVGVGVSKILYGDNNKLIYLNKQNDVIQIGSHYQKVVSGVTRTFVGSAHELYMNNAGNMYAADGVSDTCITSTLGLTASEVTEFISYLCLLNIYKTNNTWTFSNDVSMSAYNADFTAFVADLNAHTIQKVWLAQPYLIAIDTNGTAYYRQLDMSAPSIAALDLSVGVKDITHSRTGILNGPVVFHMKDNTVRYLGAAPAYQSFGGSIHALANINQVAVNENTGLSSIEFIVKNNSNTLSAWSTAVAPTYAFLSDYVDALATEEGRWIIKKNDGDYYYYNSNTDTNVFMGAGSVVTDSANNINHKRKRVFVKLANYKIAMISYNSAAQLTYDAADDGFVSIYSSDGNIIFARYANGVVRPLKILDTTSY